MIQADRNSYLLGKHKQALTVLDELATTTPDDWVSIEISI
jgi:hypothetical protein